jgi:nitronate monooxygenase
MPTWPDRRILDLLRIDVPIIQAPMAGADTVALALAVCRAGGLGSLGCALRTPEEIRAAVHDLRAGTDRPFNLNFFCHTMTPPEPGAIEPWKDLLRPFYQRFQIDIDSVPPARLRMPFDEETCALMEELAPPIVSFHFGLAAPELVDRLKQRGIVILATATSVAEAVWLEQRGCDAIIAQGIEAGGHRGMFLERDPATQSGLFALLPQVADAVRIPVSATGGIADARGIRAAFALGASAVQIGTAYLLCPEAEIAPLHRRALQKVTESGTAITTLFSGRPARGIVNRFMLDAGFLPDAALPFPYAGALVAPLRRASEKAGTTDCMQMWAGQAAALAKPMGAEELTRTLATNTVNT